MAKDLALCGTQGHDPFILHTGFRTAMCVACGRGLDYPDEKDSPLARPWVGWPDIRHNKKKKKPTLNGFGIPGAAVVLDDPPAVDDDDEMMDGD